MQAYQYYGVDNATLERVRGRVEGYDLPHALQDLKEKSITPLTITPIASGGLITGFLLECFPRLAIPPWLAKIDPEDSLSERFIIDFFSQLATLVNARITTAESLRLMSEEAPLAKLKPAEQRFLSRLYQAMLQGSDLAPALRRETAAPIPPVAVALVAAGEKSGTLKTVFKEVTDLLEASRRTKENLATVLIYPLLTLAAVFITVTLMAFFVLPSFAGLFAEIGADLPLITVIVFDSARFVVEQFWLVPLISLALAAALRYALAQPRLRWSIDRQILQLPLLGRLLTLVYTAETTAALRSLLSGGIPLYEAVKDAARVPGNRYLAWQMERAASAIYSGYDLPSSLGRDSAFSLVFKRLAAVAYNTGDLAGAMGKASEICREEAGRLMKRIETLIEPALLLIVGFVVGVTVLALALPLLDAMAVAG